MSETESDTVPALDETPPAALDIGGRRFVVVEEASALHDLYLTRYLKKSGLMPDPAKHLDPEASDDDNAFNLLVAVYDSGVTFELLAAFLADVGPAGAPEEWTPEMARANTAFFARVKGRADKAILQGILASGIQGFFRVGLASLRTSPPSSSDRPSPSGNITPAVAPTPSAPRPDGAPSPSPERSPATAAPGASGVTPSATSPTTTASASASSPDAGPSASS